MKKGKKWKKIEAFCIMLIVTLLLIFVRILYQPGTESERGELYTFSNGWYQLKDGKKTELKLPCFVTADKDGNVWLNPSGCSAMAKAGSGDVLTGVIAGLLARGLECTDAAFLGVYVHGLAGEEAARRWGIHSVLAGNLADCILCHREMRSMT